MDRDLTYHIIFNKGERYILNLANHILTPSSECFEAGTRHPLRKMPDYLTKHISIRMLGKKPQKYGLEMH
jgi:hypothetical protein